jgi:hypothetical protein
MIAEQPPPGLPLTINFNIPTYWTPEQALAVFELLDELLSRTQRAAAPSTDREPGCDQDRQRHDHDRHHLALTANRLCCMAHRR